MKRGTTIGAFVLPVVMGLAPAALAGGGSVGADAELVSQYVWRGLVLDDGWSLQPELVFAYELGTGSEVELASWWSAALQTHGSPTHRDEVFENDLVLTFSHQLGDSGRLSAGSIYYSNPFSDIGPGNETWSTTELFLGGELTPGPLSLGATLSYDLDRVKGWYLDLEGSRSLKLSDTVSLEPSVHVGLALDETADPLDPNQEYRYLENGLVDGSLAFGLTYTSRRGLSVGGALHYAHRFDGVREDENVFWVSVKVASAQ